MMETAAGLISLVAALCLTFVVLHPQIKEGLILKFGMVIIIFAMLVTFGMTIIEKNHDVHSWMATGFMLRLGILVMCIGVLLKANKVVKQKRTTDEQKTRVHMYNIMAPIHDLVEFLKDEPYEKRAGKTTETR